MKKHRKKKNSSKVGLAMDKEIKVISFKIFLSLLQVVTQELGTEGLHLTMHLKVGLGIIHNDNLFI